jgi:hypothetical protein
VTPFTWEEFEAETAPVLDCFRDRMFRYRLEAELHTLMTLCFEEARIEVSHEHRVALGRFDFFLPSGLVLEVKVRGSFAQAIRQADRYCSIEEVRGVLVVSSVPSMLNTPRRRLRDTPVAFTHIRRSSF